MSPAAAKRAADAGSDEEEGGGGGLRLGTLTPHTRDSRQRNRPRTFMPKQAVLAHPHHLRSTRSRTCRRAMPSRALHDVLRGLSRVLCHHVVADVLVSASVVFHCLRRVARVRGVSLVR